MALIECKYCKAKISDRALSCPKCGKSTLFVKINIFQAYRNFWFRAYNFWGTCGRKEFWLGFTLSLIVNIILNQLINLIDYSYIESEQFIIKPKPDESLVSNLFIYFYWASFFPLFTSTIRRFRDTETNPWFIFLNVVPIVGQIYTFIICLRGSKKRL